MNRADPSSEQQAHTPQQVLDLAVQHHTKGELSKAQDIYEQILQTDPNHPEVMRLLGVIALQVGEKNRAVDLIKKATRVKPEFAEAHTDLGDALIELRRPEEAVACYNKAIQIKPDYVQAHYNLGNTFKKWGSLMKPLPATKWPWL